MKLVNFKELVKYHPYHISTFADFANVTTDLLEAAIEGEEELTPKELFNIAYYLGMPVSVLTCPKLITLSRDKQKHRKMIDELQTKQRLIYNHAREGSKAAEDYKESYSDQIVINVICGFYFYGAMTYCRYLAAKERVEQTLSFIGNETKKPRGRERKNIVSEEKVVLDFIKSLQKPSFDRLEKIKVMLLVLERGNEHMTDFLIKAFRAEEERRPKLIEMKGKAGDHNA